MTQCLYVIWIPWDVTFALMTPFREFLLNRLRNTTQLSQRISHTTFQLFKSRLRPLSIDDLAITLTKLTHFLDIFDHPIPGVVLDHVSKRLFNFIEREITHKLSFKLQYL